MNLRLLLRLLLVAGLAVALLICAALVWLKSEIDQGLLEREAVAVLERVAGVKARLGNIALHRLGTIRIEVVEVSQPRGPLRHLSLETIEVDYDLSQLLAFRVRLEAVRLVRPRISLVLDPSRPPLLRRRGALEAPPSPTPGGPDEASSGVEGAPAAGGPGPAPPGGGAGPPRVSIGRLEIEGASLECELTGRGAPVVLSIPRLDLSARIPPRLWPIDFVVTLAPVRGLIKARGSVDRPRGQALVNFSLAGVDLAPYAVALAQKVPHVRIREATIGGDGYVSVAHGRLDYMASGEVRPLSVALSRPVTLELESTCRFTARPDRLSVGPLTLGLPGQPPLTIQGTVANLLDPEVDVTASVIGLQLAGLLALAPPGALPPIVHVKPAGTLTLQARVKGFVRRRPDVRVSLDLEGMGARVKTPVLQADLSLAALSLEARPDSVRLRRLALTGPGFDLLANARVTGLPGPPRIDLEVDRLGLEVGTLAGLLAPPSVRALAPAGKVGLRLLASADLSRLAPDVVLPRDRAALVRALKAAVERLRQGTGPPGPRVRTLLEVLGGRIEAQLDLARLSARPTALGGLPVVAGGHVRADPSRVRIDDLAVRAGSLALKVAAEVTDLLSSPRLDLAVDASDLRLAALLGLLPPGHPARRLPAEIDGRLDLGLRASGTREAPTFRLDLGVRDLRALVLALPRPFEVTVPSLALAVDPTLIRLGGLTVRTPAGSVALGLVVERLPGMGPILDLVRRGLPPSGPLRRRAIISALRLTDPSGPTVSLALGTGPDGLALSALAGLVPQGAVARLPAERRERLASLVGALCGGDRGRLRVEAEARGPVASPPMLLRIGLTTERGAVAAAARCPDPAGQREVKLEARLTVPDIAALATLAARAAGRTLALPIQPREPLEVSVTGRGDPRAASFEARLEGLRTTLDVAGTVPDLAARRLGVKGTLVPPQPASLVPMLPPAARRVFDLARPTFKSLVSFEGSVWPGGHDDLVRVQVTDIAAAWEGYTGPVKLTVPELSVKATARSTPGLAGTLEVESLRGTVVVRAKPIEFAMTGQKVAWTPSLVSAHPLMFQVAGQEGRLDLDLARDTLGARHVEATLAFHALDVGPLLAMFGPPPSEVSADGRMALSLTVRGPVERPDLLDGQAVIKVGQLTVKAFALRGQPAIVRGLGVKAVRDDVVIESAPTITFGERTFDFPLKGSLKEIARVDNLFKASPALVVARIREKAGGEKKLGGLLGEDQMARILGGTLYKIKVKLEFSDRPDPFEFKGLMSPEDTKVFNEKRTQIVQKYIRKAKQAAAETLGFKVSVMGEENFKLVQFRSVTAIVLDGAFNMVYPQFIPFWRLTITPSDW